MAARPYSNGSMALPNRSADIMGVWLGQVAVD